MPTRLDVLLQRRKSAAAGLFHRQITASASAGSRPGIRRTKRGLEGRESVAVMRRSYIKSLTISRGPAGPVNGSTPVSHLVGSLIPPDIALFARRCGKICDKPHLTSIG